MFCLLKKYLMWPTELKDVFLIEMHVEENEEFFYPERYKSHISEEKLRIESLETRISAICSKHTVGARRMQIANISQRCLRLISEIYRFHLYLSVLCKRCSFTSKTESRTPSLIVFYFHQNLARIGRDKQEHGQCWFSFYSQLLACLGAVINNVYKTN